MALILDTPETIQNTAVKYKINGISIDLRRKEIHVGYDRIQANDIPVGDEGPMFTISGPDYTAVWQDASQIAGGNVPRAIRRALYNYIKDTTGRPGTVDD